jgi:hypothetical protein
MPRMERNRTPGRCDVRFVPISKISLLSQIHPACAIIEHLELTHARLSDNSSYVRQNGALPFAQKLSCRPLRIAHNLLGSRFASTLFASLGMEVDDAVWSYGRTCRRYIVRPARCTRKSRRRGASAAICWDRVRVAAQESRLRRRLQERA